MCQGRVCSRNVAALVARPGEVPNPSMKRPIAVPVRLRDLAAAETGSEPETPETPETPEMREMRETREMREMRETREMPKTPETRGIPTSPETMEEQ